MAQRKPSGIGTSGTPLWSAVTGTYELRPDELRVLEAACRTLDELNRIEKALTTAPLTVKGSQGQEVAHPLLSQAVAHRRLYAGLVKQLDLPDEAGGSAVPSALSEKRRTAANMRWAEHNRVKRERAGG